ncbi:ABC-three component system middle component 1 [Cobetia sp. AM6]|uniref:ABC-three component system middle component 1 n=1 Tax=Cobetia sp. AM6 TaxID=2661553 RepID=UPI0012990669|nr:ABC-three component system middle component 1 [Cobetia sp. AM6]BBO56429.1 hypothetical protein CLAM6_17400 [Cobetia sp. AM6]
MMTIQGVIAAIAKRVEGRYEEPVINQELFCFPDPGVEFETCRLKRINRPNAGFKTILIVDLSYESSSLQAAFRLAADVRDILPEPETADLYMFMLIRKIPFEDATRIETDDRFCRKVVAKESEKVDELLDRTFLSSLSLTTISEGLNDPLLAALASLGDTHPWTLRHLDSWRNSLLSGKNGSEIADELRKQAFDSEAHQ